MDFFRFPTVNTSEEALFNLAEGDLQYAIERYGESQVEHAVFALFDSNVIWRASDIESLRYAKMTGRSSFLYLPPFDEREGERCIDQACDVGCSGIVLHPYLQKIGRSQLPTVRRLVASASGKGMITAVCAAYGSRDIYRYYPLESVVAAAESSDQPVVITHGGGARILDAFLIADAFSHVYLDTSFSLPYWCGSTVEDGFAFALSRLGANRFLFGSDAPFVSCDAAIRCHEEFFSRKGIPADEQELVMSGTALSLLGGG